MLQGTLKSQVETLVERAEGRRLSEDEQVEPFVAELTAAAQEMANAEETLTQRDLDAAVAPAQRALQHLLTAEAGLRDIDITLSEGAEGGGVDAGRSLAELMDLELDPERNRYETPQTPNFNAQRKSDDEEWRRLTELARRQEELARRQERGDAAAMPLSRWNLERLQRELAALQERLAERGTAPSTSSAGINGVRDAIGRALDNDELSTEAIRQGAAALRAGADQLRRQAQRAVAAQAQEAERRANALLADQQRILERLEALQDSALEAARAGSRSFAFDDFALAPEAATKRRMQRDVTQLAADLADLRQRLASAAPEAAKQLDRALDELGESRIGERLAVAAEYFEAGRPLFMISQEARVERTLAQLARRLGAVAERVDGTEGGAPSGLGAEDVQALRRSLQQVGIGGDPAALRDIAQASGRLASAVAERLSASDSSAIRELARETAARYRELGTSNANSERLYRMTLAQLDQLEVALGKTAGAPIRAQELRNDAYDSTAVARYFRKLSCGVEGC